MWYGASKLVLDDLCLLCSCPYVILFHLNVVVWPPSDFLLMNTTQQGQWYVTSMIRLQGTPTISC